MSDQFFSDGVQFVDCSASEGKGITLQMLVQMLQASELDLPIRFDEVLISPVVVSGKLCLQFAVTKKARHADDDTVMVLASA